MSDITLVSQIDRVSTLSIVLLVAIEIGIDLVQKNQRDYRDTIANIAIAIIYQFTSTTIGYWCAFAGLTFFSQYSLIHWGNSWTILLAVIVADFLYYWEHRTEHRIRFFWAYHNVHHSSTDYNLTVASRLSWIEVCILWIFYIPMALIGFNPLQIFIAVQIVALYQIWIHNQKIGRLGILERVINTPALHRVHHGSNPLYINKNFGGILIIWDRLFGTYQSETETPIYGLTKNIHTNNPLKINAIEYRYLIRDIVNSRSFKEIWKKTFNFPQEIKMK